MARNLKKPKQIFIGENALNRRDKGVEGTNRHGEAHPCAWFNAGGLSQEGVLESARNVSESFDGYGVGPDVSHPMSYL